jgi:orotidine-5'-phosphate decarboxylase
MFKNKLSKLIRDKNSLLSIGLDVDIEKIPKFLLREKDPLYIFNREIIEATKDIAIAFKPNIGFYEALGIAGWRLLEKTLQLIPSDHIIIADAKRADIYNTSKKCAEFYFENCNFDAVTVSPYMGTDSISAFLEYDTSGVFIVCLTSNDGSCDFQYLNVDDEPLYLKVARKVLEWDLKFGNCGLVVGATHPEDLSSIREIVPTIPFLIPGIGKQGGNLKYSIQYGTDNQASAALINSSRNILYASDKFNFAEAAREAALELNDEINKFRIQKNEFLT